MLQIQSNNTTRITCNNLAHNVTEFHRVDEYDKTQSNYVSRENEDDEGMGNS